LTSISIGGFAIASSTAYLISEAIPAQVFAHPLDGGQDVQLSGASSTGGTGFLALGGATVFWDRYQVANGKRTGAIWSAPATGSSPAAQVVSGIGGKPEGGYFSFTADAQSLYFTDPDAQVIYRMAH
jgi:hypothetical protein